MKKNWISTSVIAAAILFTMNGCGGGGAESDFVKTELSGLEVNTGFNALGENELGFYGKDVIFGNDPLGDSTIWNITFDDNALDIEEIQMRFDEDNVLLKEASDVSWYYADMYGVSADGRLMRWDQGLYIEILQAFTNGCYDAQLYTIDDRERTAITLCATTHKNTEETPATGEAASVLVGNSFYYTDDVLDDEDGYYMNTFEQGRVLDIEYTSDGEVLYTYEAAVSYSGSTLILHNESGNEQCEVTRLDKSVELDCDFNSAPIYLWDTIADAKANPMPDV
jgi:hypothetical protein